ncbi:MAG: hypothetical protein MUE31_01730 [Candidatus Nanopelagicales bacterium]|nr:hypothetical protein [Candidatus Nanopelagicales bacterium]
MKKALGMAGVVGVMAGSLALTSPASAEITIGDGNAVVVLTPCGKDKSLGSELVADCSYSAFKLKADGAPSYIYVTQDGYIVWKGGTITAGALDFPASGQTWPDLALKFSGIPITSSATPAKITGTVDSQGKVDLAMSFATTLKTPLGKCTLYVEDTPRQVHTQRQRRALKCRDGLPRQGRGQGLRPDDRPLRGCKHYPGDRDDIRRRRRLWPSADQLRPGHRNGLAD